MGHLTFRSKRLSAVGNKRILQFFASAREPHSRVIALVDSMWVVIVLYIDYFMVGECVRFLFTSCEESQTHSLEDSLVRLRFFTTSE